MNAMFVVTAAEAYVRQALAELRALDAGVRAMGALGPGVIRVGVSAELGRAGFLARVREREPVFVRHLHPVDLVTTAGGGAAGAAGALSAAARALLSGLDPGVRIAVHVRLFATEGSAPDRGPVRAALNLLVPETGGQLVVQAPEQILSVSADEAISCLGLSTPAENLSDWPGGEMRFRREEEQISRASFKLLEALERFAVPVHPGEAALDLGAAPGGWSYVLLQRGLRVTAVDTGDLAAAVRAHPQMTFLKQNASSVTFPADRFDLLTCDLSWNPRHTAEMVVRLAPSVRTGAHVLLTVKLMLENPTRTIRQVEQALSGAFRLCGVKQLFHNRDEVTMYLRRK